MPIVRIDLFVDVGTPMSERGSFGENRFDFGDAAFFTIAGEVHRVTIEVSKLFDNARTFGIFY